MTDDASFVHLHVHTDNSMLDGAARIPDLFDAAAAAGMPALAMTDHGNLFGAFDFWKRGIAAGVKPIIGMEGYYAPQGRQVKAPFDFGGGKDEANGDDGSGTRGSHAYTHMTVLAATNRGLRNLFQLSSRASIEGFYRHPRFDRELLAEHATGLIATTGCPSGEVNRWLQAGRFDDAVATAAEYRDILEPGNLYVEVMDHGIDIERTHREDLLRLARKLALPLVATNDLHYVHRQDAQAHDALLCVGTGAQVGDQKRFRFSGDQFYLKSAQEMRHLFNELPQACDNTLAIAERCEVSFDEGADLMPRFPVPTGHTEETWLVEKVRDGLRRRFPSGAAEVYRQRADYELAVVTQMGFPGYFLVVADLVGYAKREGIRVGPGRGSAAGSLIAYALGITELDPIVHGLLFERFLNPERVSMPDIDLDFDDRRRADMIRYATDTYGSDHVAQIITYGSIKAKAAIKDAARVHGQPYSVGDNITKAMPDAIMGKDAPLAAVFDPDHPRYGEAEAVRHMYDTDSGARTVLDTARGLEGIKRQPGVHAAGVILSRERLMDVVPVWMRQTDGAIITQFDMVACESLGLLKMDFLGLRNLTVIDDCVAAVEARTGTRIVPENLPLDDAPTYRLLARGDTLGVFQLDGGPMRALLRSMEPDNFEHISAVLALYRPGPMGANAHNDYADRKNGRKPVNPIHPELAQPLDAILGDTYGLIVYQEQVMAIAQTLAGYSLGAADLLRRAMGKKKKEVLDKEYVPFRDGMKTNGYSDAAIQVLWDILVPFSDYAFNKAHTAGYGLVSYWTAYLKANHPAEYMAALLTSVQDDKDKSALYLRECRRMGISVLPPDINTSGAHFTADHGNIRFGLAAIRNVGGAIVDTIVTSRPQGGYETFHDTLRTGGPAVCNKRVIESLIKAGAFDSLDHPRAGLHAIHADAVEQTAATLKAEASGQFDLFSDTPTDVVDTTIPDIEWDRQTQLHNERAMLGLYVSDHPLAGHEKLLRRNSTITIADLISDTQTPPTATVAGLITTVTRKTNRNGREWAQIAIEDLTGSLDVLVFSNTYSSIAHHLHADVTVTATLRVDTRDGGTQYSALDVAPLALTAQPPGPPMELHVTEHQLTVDVVTQLKKVLNRYPGTTDIHIHIRGRNGNVTWKPEVAVQPNSALDIELIELLGHSSVHPRAALNTLWGPPQLPPVVAERNAGATA